MYCKKFDDLRLNIDISKGIEEIMDFKFRDEVKEGALIKIYNRRFKN